MRKKDLKCSILLVAAVAVLAVAGCGSKGENTNTPEPTVTAAPTEAGATATPVPATVTPTPTATPTPEPTVAPEDGSLKELCEKYFKFGVGINGSTLDNLTLHSEEYMAMVKQHFNSVTLSNLMKSCYILKQDASIKNALEGDGTPVLTYESIDPTLQWCMENGVGMRGHTLVWHTQAPDWFFREGYTSDGAYVDKETMLFRMESYIKQLMTHVQDKFPGVVYCWDVVNEAVDPYSADPDSSFGCRTMHGEGEANPWYVTIGPDYVEMAFTYARKYAAEGVKLFYNDFNTYESAKREFIYTLCKDLKEKGLIDGIGMQGYWGIDYPSMTTISSTLARFGELDLEIHITELSIGVDEETEEQFEAQAKAYANVFFTIRNKDLEGGGNANITCVTVFGLIDHYNPNDTTNARLFDTNYQPKPAYYKVYNMFKSIYSKTAE